MGKSENFQPGSISQSEGIEILNRLLDHVKDITTVKERLTALENGNCDDVCFPKFELHVKNALEKAFEPWWTWRQRTNKFMWTVAVYGTALGGLLVWFCGKYGPPLMHMIEHFTAGKG